MEQAQTLGLGNRIVFAGKRQDVAELLSVMDVFVLPSLTEGQPMALLEAMASGRAIVATAVGDVPAILRAGEAGTLVRAGDTAGMADGIIRHLHDVPRALACAQKARHEVAEYYSSTAMAKEYLKVYGALLAGTASSGTGGKRSKAVTSNFDDRS